MDDIPILFRVACILLMAFMVRYLVLPIVWPTSRLGDKMMFPALGGILMLMFLSLIIERTAG